jgi:hypothetical protein
MNSITDNLAKYSLSWTFLLVFTFSLNDPLFVLFREYLHDENTLTLLISIIVGGVMPFGYLINIFPMLFFRSFPQLGVFTYAINDSSLFSKSKLIPQEVKNQFQLYKSRIEKLKKPEDIQRESNNYRSELWTHLNIEYNLITSITISFLLYIGTGFYTGNWNLGILHFLKISGFAPSLLFMILFLLILFVIITTTHQNRLLLIETYKLENNLLKKNNPIPEKKNV